MHSRRLSLPALFLALLGILATLTVNAPRAEATSTILCKGFTSCANAGYSSFGYSSVYRQMWWRMYAGHNCTNYVAYRMVSRGMPATRPWSGSGDARNWGVVFDEKVDQTPMIGSIAWWSANHVAYVQRIVDENTIVISEDHYGGDFDWRKITRSGGGWPNGFIHLNDERLMVTAAPRVRIAPQVGEPVAASRGLWENAPTSYSYKWYADGAVVSGATAPQFVPSAAQAGKRLTVKVITRKAGYLTGSAVSLATPATALGDFDEVAVPTISGLAKVDATLTAKTGSWAPAPASTTFTWRADGVTIPGAAGSTLRVGPDQLGKKITVVATAKRAGYNPSSQASAPTAEVLPAKLSLVRAPRITGLARPGQVLTLDVGTVSPASSRSAAQWLRDGVPIAGATGTTYVPTAADLGHVVGARVRHARAGYTTLATTVSMRVPVRALPRFTAVSLASGAVTVVVRADGVQQVVGKVRVTNVHGYSVEQTLAGGRTTFTPKWLMSGRKVLTFSIGAGPLTSARTVTLVVDVK